MDWENVFASPGETQLPLAPTVLGSLSSHSSLTPTGMLLPDPVQFPKLAVLLDGAIWPFALEASCPGDALYIPPPPTCFHQVTLYLPGEANSSDPS